MRVTAVLPLALLHNVLVNNPMTPPKKTEEKAEAAKVEEVLPPTPIPEVPELPKSKLDEVLKPYKAELPVLRSYVPKELSKSPDAYLVLIISLMSKSNKDKSGTPAPPRISDLMAFMYQVYRTKLDPIARQIYPVYRAGGLAVQTSIDGFRLVASRTGHYGGSDDIEFEEVDGKPAKAKCTVYLLNPHTFERMAVVATARWSEYQAGGPMWASKPFIMLGKCAEALALRKAFPQELSGIYTVEEMAAEEKDKTSKESVEKVVNNYQDKKKVDSTFKEKVEE